MRLVTGAEKDLERLFNPRSIAIVGASSKEGTLSSLPLRFLRTYGFTGHIYPINPTQTEVDGLPAYASLFDVPGPIDLAIIPLSAERALEAVHQCADIGVRGAVLPSHGFGELGGEAKRIETAMVRDARARGLRIIGPNTDGIGNFGIGALATIQPAFGELVRSGPVAVVSQSGATAGSLISRLREEGIGCRLYAATGNEADLGFADYLSFMVQDPEVRIVLGFVETIRRPVDFVKVAALAAEDDKPIALIKVGSSREGARRAAAHTGSLAGSDRLYSSFFSAAGVLRVRELSELVSVAKLFVTQGAPRGRGVGIISVSGGQAGVMADVAAIQSLEIPSLDASAEKSLDEVLRFGKGFNPCDLTGQIATEPDLVARVYKSFATQPSMATIVYGRKRLTGSVGPEVAAAFAVAAGSSTAVNAVYSMDGSVSASEMQIFNTNRIPVYDSLHELFGAIEGLRWQASLGRRRYARKAKRLSRLTVLRMPTPDRMLNELQSRSLLSQYGITGPTEKLVHDPKAAQVAAMEIGFPVVLKAVSQAIAHKTEAGVVAVGLMDSNDVASAYGRIWQNALKACSRDDIAGVLVQEQVIGVEMVLGIKVDPTLGPFVMLGTGGLFVELLDDVVFLPAPVSKSSAALMLSALRGRSLLEGYRAGGSWDVEALLECVVRISEFASDHAHEIEEVDINPLIVLPVGHGVRAVDTLMILKQPTTEPENIV